LLIVVGRDHGLIEPEGEGEHGRTAEPRDGAVGDIEEARRIGEIDDDHRLPCSHEARQHNGGALPKTSRPIFMFINAYSISCRSAAAAANGPTTRLARVNAQRIVNGVPNGTGPLSAAFAAATPKMSTGTVSGNTRTASRRPPRRSVTAIAAPISPMKVKAGVPARSVSASAASAGASRLRKRPMIGAATTSGRPVVSQWATPLTATTSSSGTRP